MGQTRFLVARREYLPPKAAERAYLAGLDDIPWRTRVLATEAGLVAERVESESGSFHVLWNVVGRGRQMLATATLIERPEPYNLSVELARGTLNRVKANVVAWELAGLPVPPQVAADTARAMNEFVAAVAALERPAEAAEHGQRAVEAAPRRGRTPDRGVRRAGRPQSGPATGEADDPVRRRFGFDRPRVAAVRGLCRRLQHGDRPPAMESDRGPGRGPAMERGRWPDRLVPGASKADFRRAPVGNRQTVAARLALFVGRAASTRFSAWPGNRSGPW